MKKDKMKHIYSINIYCNYYVQNEQKLLYFSRLDSHLFNLFGFCCYCFRATG